MPGIRSTLVARTMRAPRQQAWRAMTDLQGLRRDVGHGAELELLTAGVFGPGTRWRETRRVGRRPAGYIATGAIRNTEARLSYHLVDHGLHQTGVVAMLEYQSAASRSFVGRLRTAVRGTPAGRLLCRELEHELTGIERTAHQHKRS